MQLQSKHKEKNLEAANSINLKDVIQHRPTPRKDLSVKDKMENLKICIDKLQSYKDAKNKKSESKTVSSSKHNHEIKSKSDVTSDKEQVKKIPGKRGRKKKIVS